MKRLAKSSAYVGRIGRASCLPWNVYPWSDASNLRTLVPSCRDRSITSPMLAQRVTVKCHTSESRMQKVTSIVRFLMGKARVAPVKTTTIPRLELTAATVSVRVGEMISNELDEPVEIKTYWTDSTTVLKYIRNDKKRFHVFVTNRVQMIRDATNPDQWKYVESKLNPADDASRGFKGNELSKQHRWITGPNFL